MCIHPKVSNVLFTDSKLYVVSTPIGNLADISFRAIETLKRVTLIAAEDTRHSKRLMQHYGITTPLIALHEHNERAMSAELIRRILDGASIALTSDAGTPLVSDPGFPLVRMAKDAGIAVVPIPGACAMIAALSVSGLPTDRFSFEGFAPRNEASRRAWLEKLKNETGTIIFYESSHRIRDCLMAVAEIFPAERPIVIARELTKVHETVVKTAVGNVSRLVDEDPYMRKGEFVILLQGASENARGDELTLDQQRILKRLLKECSIKTATALAAEITGARKKILYQAALKLQKA